MQGNTIVNNSSPETITPQDVDDPRFDKDEIFQGLRFEMKRTEYPNKTKAKAKVIANLEKNPKFYSDLNQYINSDK
jgi:hypothetical protein